MQKIINLIGQIKACPEISTKEKVRAINSLRRMMFDREYWNRVKLDFSGNERTGIELMSMFTWDFTSEGDPFWSSINRRIT